MIIGEVLTTRRVITKKELKAALNIQRDRLFERGTAVPLGKVIVELGYATESDIVSAVNEHYRINATSLSDNIRGLIRRIGDSLNEEVPAPRVPIWLQLSITMTVVMLLTVSLLSYVILDRQKTKLYNHAVKLGMVSLGYFGSNARIPLLEDDILSLNTLLKNAEGVDGHLYALIVDTQGVIKAHTNARQIGKEMVRFPPSGRVETNGDVTYFTYESGIQGQVLNMSLPIAFKSKPLGEVHVGLSIDFIDQLFLDERAFLVVSTFVVCLFGIVVALLFGRRFSKPISQLVGATQEFAKGNYGYRVDSRRNDELGRLATAFNRMGKELFKQSMIRESFGKYVGSDVLELIMRNPQTTWLKGRKNMVTVLFCDIRGFTAYTETRPPEELLQELNNYFEIATSIILKHGGYVDKFIGDAVLAVFGVPVNYENHMERCVRAAVEMQQAFKLAAESRRNPLLMRVGISIMSGPVVAGSIGSQAKMEYTVIGDTVNVASYLNSLAEGGEIVVGRNIIERHGNILEVESLVPQKIKGRSGLVEVYRVTGLKKRRPVS
ncbi:MAG: HAMP domain-containing protein [Desulfobacterales bacterium]|nr:HAMP domain-containing protein [Desulfobacterales bacterium]